MTAVTGRRSSSPRGGGVSRSYANSLGSIAAPGVLITTSALESPGGASKAQATRELGLEHRTVWGWMQRWARPIVKPGDRKRGFSSHGLHETASELSTRGEVPRQGAGDERDIVQVGHTPRVAGCVLAGRTRHSFASSAT